MTPIRYDWGQFDFILKEYCATNHISKSRLLREADLQFAQLKNYYDNTVTRPDLAVLARICFALDCELYDILIYTPPKQKQQK